MSLRTASPPASSSPPPQGALASIMSVLSFSKHDTSKPGMHTDLGKCRKNQYNTPPTTAKQHNATWSTSTSGWWATCFRARSTRQTTLPIRPAPAAAPVPTSTAARHGKPSPWPTKTKSSARYIAGTQAISQCMYANPPSRKNHTLIVVWRRTRLGHRPCVLVPGIQKRLSMGRHAQPPHTPPHPPRALDGIAMHGL